MTSLQSSQPVSLPFRHIRRNSIRFQLEALFASVRERRDPVTRESKTPLVMWHLVAAVLNMKGKLDIATISSQPVQSPIRIGNTLIHVTHCPERELLHDCRTASDQGLRPLIVSTRAGAAQAEVLAGEVAINRRLEVLDITQFLVANMLEWTNFDGSQRRHTFEDLITRYNTIVEACETDPSLKIEVA